MSVDPAELLKTLTRRYGGAQADGLQAILCPVLIPIRTLDSRIFKVDGQQHWRASFSINIASAWEELIVPGRTGKFVPQAYQAGGGWLELAKGRILEVDTETRIAHGEVYCGGKKSELESSLAKLNARDCLEIDQYGAAAKVLSGLVEYSLVQNLKASGYTVQRMPEDMARHIGTYRHYDFEVIKNGVRKKLEVKSLWGTNTKFARLIHSKTENYPTSSCKFETQHFFAVSLFLRTGRISDFAFARSVPRDVRPHGLPRAERFPDHVNQNPTCDLGDGTWFPKLEDVWELD